MADETSSDGGATPTSGMPATGATSASATPAKPPSMTIEDALAQIEELKRHAASKEEQAQRHGKNLTSAEKRLAEYEAKEKQAQEAQLSELEKTNKRAQEIEQKLQATQRQLVEAHVKMAAQAHGIINPDIAAAAIRDTLTYGDDGMPSNLEDALKELIKGNPYLVAPKAAVPTPEPAQQAQPASQQTPAIPAMNPGRGAITSPTTNLKPGHIPRLSDLYTI